MTDARAEGDVGQDEQAGAEARVATILGVVGQVVGDGRPVPLPAGPAFGQPALPLGVDGCIRRS